MDLTSYSPRSKTLSLPATYENTYRADLYRLNESTISLTTPNFWPWNQSPVYSDSTNSASTSPTIAMKSFSAWPNMQTKPFEEMGDLSPASTTPEDAKMSASPCLPPQSLRRRSPLTRSGDCQPEAESQHPPSKRGRPRLYRQTRGSSGSASEKASYPKRLPHNQVERKYREGLNMGLEQLRRAVPTLPQGDCGAAIGVAKPSKAMVLAAAIDYIKKIEKERDEAMYQVEALGGKVGAARWKC